MEREICYQIITHDKCGRRTRVFAIEEKRDLYHGARFVTTTGETAIIPRAAYRIARRFLKVERDEMVVLDCDACWYVRAKNPVYDERYLEQEEGVTIYKTPVNIPCEW